MRDVARARSESRAAATAPRSAQAPTRPCARSRASPQRRPWNAARSSGEGRPNLSGEHVDRLEDRRVRGQRHIQRHVGDAERARMPRSASTTCRVVPWMAGRPRKVAHVGPGRWISSSQKGMRRRAPARPGGRPRPSVAGRSPRPGGTSPASRPSSASRRRSGPRGGTRRRSPRRSRSAAAGAGAAWARRSGRGAGDGASRSRARAPSTPSGRARAPRRCGCPRSLKGTPSAANSPSIHPTPAPKMRRPPDRTSTLARSLATGSGDR